MNDLQSLVYTALLFFVALLGHAVGRLLVEVAQLLYRLRYRGHHRKEMTWPSGTRPPLPELD